MRIFPVTLAAFVLCFIAATSALNGSRSEVLPGVRLRLTAEQLDNLGSGEQIPLTQEQKQRVLAATGKEVPAASIVYSAPDGEVSELGYNLALRDRPDSILLLNEYILDESKIPAKKAGDDQMIGPPEKPAKEYAEFLINGQGRIWKLMGTSDFLEYLRAHQGKFGDVWIDTTSPKDSSSLPFQDSLRFMKWQLKKAGVREGNTIVNP
jgi:hypothetical protein